MPHPTGGHFGTQEPRTLDRMEANMTRSEAKLHGSIDGPPMQVVTTGRALGAEIRGIDLNRLDEASFARIVQAWHDHSVILVRDQALDDAELVGFSRRFGELDWAPIQETGRRFVEGMPEIYVVSNVTVNGEPIGNALRPRSAAVGRQHLVLQHVRRL